MEEYGLKGNEDLTDSLTYRLALIKDLQIQLDTNKITMDDFKFLKMAKKTLKEQEHNKEFICGHNYYDTCDKVFDNRYALLQHEKNCFNIIETKQKETKMRYLECDICNKKFYYRGQQMDPKYLKARHEKTCRKNIDKNLRKKIKNNLDNLDRIKLQNIVNYIDNDVKLLQPQSPIPSPRRYTPSPSPRSYTSTPLSSGNELTMEINDRPVSSSSTSSVEWMEWSYNNSTYGVDNDNNVFDIASGHNIGIRYKDELNEDWRLDYE